MVSRQEETKETILRLVPTYRESPTCYNCANCTIEGFFGDKSRCTIHKGIMAWDTNIADMPMNHCFCDDWRKKEEE